MLRFFLCAACFAFAGCESLGEISSGGDSGSPSALDAGSGPGPDAGAPAPVSVSVTPRTAQATFGGKVQLVAQVAGSSDTTVVWTVTEGPSAGVLSANGQFTAASLAGTFHVVATSHADPTVSDTVTVSVGPSNVDPCVAAGNCQPGVWVDVTPAAVSLVELPAPFNCGNYGTKSVQLDPTHPDTLYAMFMCQGVWKSTDYGQSFQGPINTGLNGSLVQNCAGVIAVAPGSNGNPPQIYAACIRGSVGLWKSTNGGIDWARLPVGPMAPGGAAAQEFYAPVIDPYDSNHLLMVGHAVNLLVESIDGGQTWSAVTTHPMMEMHGGTGGIQFINTGNAATTRKTWLWLSVGEDRGTGTWRTENAGVGDWARVENNEHLTGTTQIYQPDTSGVVFMAGVYSQQGWGVLRSTDYGKTWNHVGKTMAEAIVFGTPKNVYAMSGSAVGPGGMNDPSLEQAAQPGTGSWTAPGTPAAMRQGPAQAAVTHNGANSIILTASYNAGLWRYVEP
jgi:hypothetical protein